MDGRAFTVLDSSLFTTTFDPTTLEVESSDLDLDGTYSIRVRGTQGVYASSDFLSGDYRSLRLPQSSPFSLAGLDL